MKRLAWIYRGPLANGQFQEMEEADLEQAIAEGWAQDVQRTGEGMTPSTSFKPVEPGPHEAAERYATRIGTYQTRIMEPAPVSAPVSATGPAPPVPQQPATIPPPIPEPTIPPPDPHKDVQPAPSGPAPQKPVPAAKTTSKKPKK
jgi:hypothetical protein